MLVARKWKCNHKLLCEKFQTLKDLKKGMSNKDIAAKYGVPKNTLSTLVKNKEKLLNSLEKGSNIKRQKLWVGNFEMVDETIFNCFLSMWSQNVPSSTAMIQEKALTTAKELHVKKFQATDGWLQRWKWTTFKTVSGKSKSVTSEMFDRSWETSLPTLSSNYEVKDICNADEFGLFYKCLPNKTYQIKSENSSDGKLSKIHITSLAVANTVEDKWPMFVTGKDKKSWCFKNVNFLHCCYRNQWKCWMNAVLFEEWVRQMEKKFLFEGML